jgi:hypothetical protein
MGGKNCSDPCKYTLTTNSLLQAPEQWFDREEAEKRQGRTHHAGKGTTHNCKAVPNHHHTSCYTLQLSWAVTSICYKKAPQ